MKNVDISEISKRIDELIKVCGYTKRNLLEKLGVSITTIYKWVNVESVLDIQHLSDLSSIFNVTIDYIING